MSDEITDLEREIEISRAKLDLTIDRLQDKLTVSGLVDDALGAARRGRYSPLFDRTLRTLRENPVPVLLLAAGISLLLQRAARRPAAGPVTHVMSDEDLPPAPPEPRLYEPGAASIPARDEREGRRRPANLRI